MLGRIIIITGAHPESERRPFRGTSDWHGTLVNKPNRIGSLSGESDSERGLGEGHVEAEEKEYSKGGIPRLEKRFCPLYLDMQSICWTSMQEWNHIA